MPYFRVCNATGKKKITREKKISCEAKTTREKDKRLSKKEDGKAEKKKHSDFCKKLLLKIWLYDVKIEQ